MVETVNVSFKVNIWIGTKSTLELVITTGQSVK